VSHFDICCHLVLAQAPSSLFFFSFLPCNQLVFFPISCFVTSVTRPGCNDITPPPPPLHTVSLSACYAFCPFSVVFSFRGLWMDPMNCDIFITGFIHHDVSSSSYVIISSILSSYLRLSIILMFVSCLIPCIQLNVMFPFLQILSLLVVRAFLVAVMKLRVT
jgi:hypothetical protein